MALHSGADPRSEQQRKGTDPRTGTLKTERKSSSLPTAGFSVLLLWEGCPVGRWSASHCCGCWSLWLAGPGALSLLAVVPAFRLFFFFPVSFQGHRPENRLTRDHQIGGRVTCSGTQERNRAPTLEPGNIQRAPTQELVLPKRKVSLRGGGRGVPASGCCSSGWVGAPGRWLARAALWGLVCFPFSFRGRHPEDRLFNRYPHRSSGTSVPCTRSPESAGQFVEYFVMDQMVGSRRSPGATILGGESVFLICQPSAACPADRFLTS